MSRHYREARRKARQKIRFYNHLKVYVVVNLLMAAGVIFSGPGFHWFPTPFFWGIGLLLHYIKVFGLPGTNGLYTEDWEKRIFEEELDQLRKEEDDFEELDLRSSPKEKQKSWDDSDLV